MSFRIIQSGIQCQFQDQGRFGQMAIGVPNSGAIDQIAYAFNNQLLNNPANTTQLEMALGNVILECTQSCIFALTGAHANAQIDNETLVNWATHRINKGQMLTIGFPKNGVYTYLGVSGGFSAPSQLGSSSTTKRIFLGDNLEEGYDLKSQSNNQSVASAMIIPHHRPDYQSTLIDVLPSYQYDLFSNRSKLNFTRNLYQISNANRMGVKLEGTESVPFQGEIASEATVLGSIQITNAGDPIVLLNDAQSVGGYPKIGVIPSYALSILVNKQKNKQIYFRFVSEKEALIKESLAKRRIQKYNQRFTALT